MRAGALRASNVYLETPMGTKDKLTVARNGSTFRPRWGRSTPHDVEMTNHGGQTCFRDNSLPWRLRSDGRKSVRRADGNRGGSWAAVGQGRWSAGRSRCPTAALTMRDARADPVFRGKDPRAPWTCEPHVRERHAGERDREARAGNTHVRCDASGASRAGDL